MKTLKLITQKNCKCLYTSTFNDTNIILQYFYDFLIEYKCMAFGHIATQYYRDREVVSSNTSILRQQHGFLDTDAFFEGLLRNLIYVALMQPGTAGLTLTSDTDIDSHGSIVLALDTQNSARERRCGSKFMFCVIYCELLLNDASHCESICQSSYFYTQSITL